MSAETARQTRELSLNVRKALIASDGALSNDLVTVAEETAGQFGMPLAGITLMGGKPYVNATGLTWLVQNDSRGVVEITAEKLRDAWDDPQDMRAEYRGMVRFRDGSVFTATGFASLRSVRMSSMKNPDFINMLCETRAKNRAMRSATGCSLTSAEEMDRAEIVTITPDAQPQTRQAGTLRVIEQYAPAEADELARLQEEIEAWQKNRADLVQRVERKYGVWREWDLDRCRKALEWFHTERKREEEAAQQAQAQEAAEIGEAIDPKSPALLERAIADARALVADITANAAKGRPNAGDLHTMRAALVDIQGLDGWEGDKDPNTIPKDELLGYFRARLAGYETDAADDEDTPL